MLLIISQESINVIKQELEINKPYEACGVLVGVAHDDTISVEYVVPVTNVKPTRTSFELDPKQYYDIWNRAYKEKKDIVGVYHTHPYSSAIPSSWDKETMKNDLSVWLIAGIDGVKAYIWDNGVKKVSTKLIP